MYNVPYFNNYRDPNNNTQPIQNIFTNQLPQNDLFMAKFLNENEQAENQFITTKTAFIDLHKNELTIRDMTGDIKKYQIIPPLDEKDIKIKSLETELRSLKEMMKHESKTSDQSINDGFKSITNDSEHGSTKSTVK